MNKPRVVHRATSGYTPLCGTGYRSTPLPATWKRPLPLRPLVTTNPAHVTCKRCLRDVVP